MRWPGGGDVDSLGDDLDPSEQSSPDVEVLDLSSARPSASRVSADVLDEGRPPSRAVRWLVMALMTACLVWLVVRLVPPPPAPARDFTFNDIMSAYYGMVRGDGSNNLSTFTPDNFADPASRAELSPADCASLLDQLFSTNFPEGGIDGAQTYWIDPAHESISLLTVRYPTRRAALDGFAHIEAAATSCADERLTAFDDRYRVTPLSPADTVQNARRFSYQLAPEKAPRCYAVHLMLLANTVSWQLRDIACTDYSPVPADQLFESLRRQLESIRESPGSG